MEKAKNGIEVLDRSVLQLHCWYQQNDELGQDKYWSGSVIRDYDQIGSNNKRIEVSDIEGSINEYQTKTIGNLKLPEQRYLYGIDGINRNEGTINFTIYPAKGRPFGGPIDYMFKYDESDNYFYGVWFFVNEITKSSRYGGYARLEVQKCINEEDEEKYDIDSNLWKLDAYNNNAIPISYMINNNLSNLLPHEEVDNSTFESAKSYFKRNAKTLKMFLGEGE